MEKKIKIYTVPFLVFISVALIMTFSWFRQGFIYGGGDVGLQTYNPQRILEISKYIWWEATAPGSPVPQALTAIPFNFLFSLLQGIGFSPLALQATLFFLILSFMGLGMYFLILFIFGHEYKKYALLGGFFYLVNPYMMIQIWHRFVHSTFFFSAALPFLIIFWLEWIKKKKPLALLSFLLTNLFALYAFGTLAYILTLWLLLLLITISEVIFPWSNFKTARRIFFLFIIGLIFWILTNCWWLVPIFKIAPSFLSEQQNVGETLATIYTLGAQTVLPYSLQMINPFYMFDQLDFGSNYKNVFVRLLPWIFVSVIFIGLLRGLYNQKSVRWSLIYLIIFMFSKGVAAPFGYFYIFGLKYFFPLGVLRNPFEKVGILLPLMSSILLVIGTKAILDFLKKRADSVIIKWSLLIAFLLIFSFCIPMFTGQIFGKFDKPEFVEVPQSYKDADQWIKKDYAKDLSINPGKILHLPLSTGEGITYNWSRGYSGLESSALFFTAAPSISHGFNIKQIDNSLSSLYLSLHTPLLMDQKKILRVLQDFNVRYIILHKDVSWQNGEFYDPSYTEEVLNKLEFLTVAQKFGDLIIYRVSDNFFRPKITLATGFDLTTFPSLTTLWPWVLSDNKTLITDLNGQKNDKLNSLSKNTLVFPKSFFTYNEASSASTLSLIDQLVSNKDSTKLWLDPLTKLQAVYKQNNEIQGEEINDKLIAATGKILNILRSVFIENKQLSIPDLEDYADEIQQIFSSHSAVLSYYAKDNSISSIFQTQLYMLRVITQKTQPNDVDRVIKIGDLFKDNLIKNNFISSYFAEGKNSEISQKSVLKFDIPKDAEYDLLLTAPIDKDLNEARFRNTIAIMDGKVNYLNGKKDGNILSFGKIFLSKGIHEIVLPLLYSDNLLSNKTDNIKITNANFSNNIISLDSLNNQLSFFSNNIDNVVGGDIDTINFEANVESGSGFYIYLSQDTYVIDNQKSQKNYQATEFFNQTPEQGWSKYSFPLPRLRTNAIGAAFGFFLTPTDNKGLDQRGKVRIKNFEARKIFNGDILLRSQKAKNLTDQNDTKSLTISPELISQENPVYYTGKVNIDKSSFFIFSDSFHPSWKLTLQKDGKDYIPAQHYLANLYSNAWFIEEPGAYSFKLEFESQKIVNYGFVVAFVTYLSLVLYSGVIAFKKYEKSK